MSRAEEAAYEKYPDVPGKDWVSINKDFANYHDRGPFIEGYGQGEKKTIDRAVEWFKNNWREYVYTDRDGTVHFGHWENNFRKAMEEE